MNNKSKTFFLILGLMVCLLIVFVTTGEVSQETELENRIDHPTVVTQSVVHAGTHWIIQTTCKLLKPIQ